MQAFFMQHELFRVGGAHRLQTSRGWVLYSAWDVSLQIDALQTVRVILNKSTKTEKSEVDALVSGASNSNGKIRPSLNLFRCHTSDESEFLSFWWIFGNLLTPRAPWLCYLSAWYEQYHESFIWATHSHAQHDSFIWVTCLGALCGT